MKTNTLTEHKALPARTKARKSGYEKRPRIGASVIIQTEVRWGKARVIGHVEMKNSSRDANAPFIVAVKKWHSGRRVNGHRKTVVTRDLLMQIKRVLS